jgi:hypothetical protein
MSFIKSLLGATALALALSTTGGVLVSQPALAQSSKESDKKGPKLSRPVVEALKPAQEFAQKKDFKSALGKVKEAQALPNLTTEEVYTINEFLGYVCANLKDYACAAKAFEAKLNTGLVPAGDQASTTKALIQLNYEIDNKAKTAEWAEKYLKQFGADTDVQVLLAQMAFQAKDMKNAERWIGEAIKTADKAGKKVPEEWLQMQVSTVYQQGDRSRAQSALEQLARRYPSAEHWRDVIDGVQSQAGLGDREALALYRLKQMTGALSEEGDYVEMAQLALQLALPGLAQSVVQSGMDAKILGGANAERHKRLMTMATNQAKDDRASLASLEKEAAAKPSGEPLVKLGEAYDTYGDPAKAATLIQQGIAKGGLQNADAAQVSLAIALLQQGKVADAKAALGKVKGGKSGDVARLWALYADTRTKS